MLSTLPGNQVFNVFLQHKINEYDHICEDALESSKAIKELNFRAWLDSPWKGFFVNRYGKVELKMKKDTGIEEETLTHIGNVRPFYALCERIEKHIWINVTEVNIRLSDQ